MELRYLVVVQFPEEKGEMRCFAIEMNAQCPGLTTKLLCKQEQNALKFR